MKALTLLAGLTLLSTSALGQDITRTWYLDNVRFDSGAVATGSFDYNTEPDNPLGGQYGTYSNINIDVTSPNGTVREFRRVNPASRGNRAYVSVVAAPAEQADLTGEPFLALTPPAVLSEDGSEILEGGMTNAGGVLPILPGPQNLSYLGVCRQANCGPADAPYEEALAGGRIIAGPRVWRLDNVRFDSGAVATGSFVYDEEPYAPLGGLYGRYSAINIDVTSPDGTVRKFRRVNPASRGNSAYVSVVAPPEEGDDLTGAPFLALTPPAVYSEDGSEILEGGMTNAGGVLPILPGPQDLSYIGVCRHANCGPADAPYEEALAGGRIISNPGPQRWYLEGIRFDSGAVATGYFDYDEQPYAPLGGLYGTFSNINIDVTSPNGTVREFRIVNPASRGNEAYVSVVAATGGDLTGAPFLALTVPGGASNDPEAPTTISPSPLALNSLGGVRPVLPGPQNLSYVGVCRQANCGPADAPYEEAFAGGRLTTEVAPPTINSAATVSVPENQTSVIDVNATDNLDSEGSGLTYAKSGGADQALFNLDTTTGVVTFISAPDFEVPGDAGADNIYNVQVTVTDLGGRTDVQDIAVTVTDVVEDATPPTASPTFDPPANAAGWYNADVTITWNWADEAGGSGIDPNNCEPTSTLSGEGPLATVGQCTDLAGNLGLQGSGSINIDKTAPVASPTFAPAANVAGWYNGDVTITWNWTDAPAPNGQPLSGIDPANCPPSVTLSGEGPLAIVGQCTDVAGNLGLQGSGTVNIDKTAPETTITASPPATSTSDNATFEFSGTDATSGIAGFECTFDNGTVGVSGPCTSPQNYTNLANGGYTFTVLAIDSAGNRDPSPASHTWTVDVPVPDTTPPTANPTFDPAPNAANWHNSDVTITFNWTDNEGGSGIDANNCNQSTLVNGEGASVGYGGGCLDLEGNVGETTGFLLIDKTAPETTITATPANPSTTGDATFEFSGTDATSGITSFECSFDDGTAGVGGPCNSPQNYTDLANGTYTFTVFAVDLAGNRDQTPTSYSWTVALGNAPVITSSNTASVEENQTSAIDVNATDDVNAENNGLLFSISGGADQGQFSIDGNTGVVSFTVAPDYEAPADADAGNNYEVQVTVADESELTAVQDIVVSVTDVIEAVPCAPAVSTRKISQTLAWHILSLPCGAPASATMADLINDPTVSDDPKMWAAYTFDAAGTPADYVKLTASSPIPLAGTGFWFATAEPVTLTMPDGSTQTPLSNALPCSSGQPCYLHSVGYQTGWNLLGNPSGETMLYDEIQLTNESTNCNAANPCTLNTATTNNLLSGFFLFNEYGNSYTEFDDGTKGKKVVKPWDGFWAAFKPADDSGITVTDNWELYMRLYPSQFLFISAATYTGNLGGLTGADATCQGEATNAGLPGSYKAWLSDFSESPSSRFTLPETPYMRADGNLIANSFTDLTDSLLANPINLTATGSSIGTDLTTVWTNTTAVGASNGADTDCAGWLDQNTAIGLYGSGEQTDAQWTSSDSQECSLASRLYCAEQ